MHVVSPEPLVSKPCSVYQTSNSGTMRQTVFYVESNDIVPPCPSCHGKLVYRDRKRRIVKNEGGTRKWLMIRRFRCSKCMKLHNELPSVVLPYKHYDGEVISGVLEKVVTPGDLDSEDCCCSHELLLTCSVLRHGRRKG